MHQHHTFYENSGDVTNISFNENESKNGESFKAYMDISQIERRSSDIDGLRASALENIDKDKLVCKSAECLLNDYGDLEPLNKIKKQRSCELLDINIESQGTTRTNAPKTKRGHLRSKSASLVKNTIVKQYRNHLRREKINSGKSAIDITANPQITLTKNITDSSRRKCHTLPKSLDASKLEDLTMKNELPNSIKLDNRTKKREKISNMLNSIAGEKKEIMRYDFPNKLMWIDIKNVVFVPNDVISGYTKNCFVNC